MGEEKDRRYWVTGDRRTEMEQVTFGPKVQTYVAQDYDGGTPVTTVLYFVNIKNLPHSLAINFAERFCGITPPEYTVGSMLASLDEYIIFHQYMPRRKIALNRIGTVEKAIIEILDKFYSAFLN